MALAADDPDLELVRALQSGEEGALSELMRRHEEALFRFLYRYALNATDAADLAQETFVRAYFKIHQFKPGAKFSVWLYRIALNLARDHARSRTTRQARVSSELPVGGRQVFQNSDSVLADAVVPDPSRALENKEEMRALEAAINTLPADLKQAFILMALEGHSQRDCGEMLGASPKAVETRVYRARKLLAAKLRHLWPLGQGRTVFSKKG